MNNKKMKNSLQKSLIRISLIIVIFISISVGTLCFDIYRRDMISRYQNYAGDPNTKSKLVAGLLGIFLGTFGVHNFYLGYNGKAVAQLLMTILSCGALAAVSAVWGLIEGILILAGSTITTDATGRPLGE